jgi:histidinol-phosphate phosphatase family protein
VWAAAVVLSGRLLVGADADALAAAVSCAVVVPTVGRPSLAPLIDAIAHAESSPVAEIVVVDDRPGRCEPLVAAVDGELPIRFVRTGGRGPAAARNAGWRATTAPWVVFLDDDVLPDPGWVEALAADLRDAGPDVVAVQGRIHVPLPSGRALTDWERQTAGLADAVWATADMAYRRDVLAAVGGFDPAFPRAYREDADLGLRAADHGRIVTGRRCVEHPVRPAPWWISVRRQAGNADDVRMYRKHGRHWRRRSGAPPGRRPRHLAATVGLVVGLAAHRRAPWLARAGGAMWLALTLDLAAARIRPGPRSAAEVATMLATSALIPPAAALATARGWLARSPRPAPALPAAVLFDRDGTLVVDVPYNGDPDAVRLVPGARAALDRLRAAGVAVGVVSNQSGVARGLLTTADVEACNRRLRQLVGPLGTVRYCPHDDADGCSCRKPQPGLIHQAAADLGVACADCVVVGDIAADVGAAAAAGARAILVPSPATDRGEVLAAPVVAPDLDQAVSMILAGAA